MREDLEIFRDHCVFMWSVYRHSKVLFEHNSDDDRARMERTASIFFGDICRILHEYVILQVCKITDPPRSLGKKDNHTVDFLLERYGTGDDPEAKRQLDVRRDRLMAFRAKVLPARNKFISHSDRDAIMAGQSLGGMPDAEWEYFWSDLERLVGILHEKVLGSPLRFLEVGMASDADGLLKALRHAECFDRLLNIGDPALTQLCADLALGEDRYPRTGN